MPQMNPSFWELLYLTTFCFLLMTMIKLYFTSSPLKLKKNKSSFSPHMNLLW